MDPSTYATRMERANGEECQCGHIMGLHRTKDNFFLGHCGVEGCDCKEFKYPEQFKGSVEYTRALRSFDD